MKLKAERHQYKNKNFQHIRSLKKFLYKKKVIIHPFSSNHSSHTKLQQSLDFFSKIQKVN